MLNMENKKKTRFLIRILANSSQLNTQSSNNSAVAGTVINMQIQHWSRGKEGSCRYLSVGFVVRAVLEAYVQAKVRKPALEPAAGQKKKESIDQLEYDIRKHIM